jgi:release factor glutamine methyltransferase
MYAVRSYLRSLKRSDRARTRADRPSVFTMWGRQWDLLHDVFPPNFSPSTGVSLEFIGSPQIASRLPGTSMLEIGSGTGVVAVTAALLGCARVVAGDVNPHAVRNSAANAARHGVADRVTAVHSDLFDRLDPADRFDVVFWHSNYVLAPASYRYRTLHEAAYVDPGYATHRRFLREAPRWTAPGGRVLLHFSSRGDLPALRAVAAQCERDLAIRQRRTIEEGTETVEHLLIEVMA